MDDEAKWLGTKWVRVKCLMFLKKIWKILHLRTNAYRVRVIGIFSKLIYLYLLHTHR